MRQGNIGLGTMLALGMAVSVPAWGTELKIGVVEPQKILDGTKSGKKIKDSLAEYVKVRQKLIEQEEEDLKKMQDDLVKQGAVLSPEAKKEKEESLRRRMVEFQRKYEQLNQEVQAKKKEGLDEFYKTIEQIVRSIADKEKITLVVEKSDNGSGSVIIYSHPSLDLTDRVIKELDAKGAK
jgi:outer membrane protein